MVVSQGEQVTQKRVGWFVIDTRSPCAAIKLRGHASAIRWSLFHIATCEQLWTTLRYLLVCESQCLNCLDQHGKT